MRFVHKHAQSVKELCHVRISIVSELGIVSLTGFKSQWQQAFYKYYINYNFDRQMNMFLYL